MPSRKASGAAELAEKMLRVLRQRREPGAPLTLAELAALADPAAGPRAVLAVLYQRKTFGPFAVAARRDLAAPVALADDLPRLAASPQLLEYALRCTRTASNHAASLADLKKKLMTKLQAPFQEAVQQHIQQGTLPTTVGWVLIKASKKLFLLSDLHAESVEPTSGGRKPPVDYDQTGGLRPPLAAPDFARTFDEAFARLDRQAGGYNFVSLVDLRPALSCDRAAFDAGLRTLRGAGRYTLSAAEGRHGLTAAERDAGITEDGTLLLFVSRKSP